MASEGRFWGCWGGRGNVVELNFKDMFGCCCCCCCFCGWIGIGFGFACWIGNVGLFGNMEPSIGAKHRGRKKHKD